eukprot:1353677-Amphidinium_carterae.3
MEPEIIVVHFADSERKRYLPAWPTPYCGNLNHWLAEPSHICSGSCAVAVNEGTVYQLSDLGAKKLAMVPINRNRAIACFAETSDVAAGPTLGFELGRETLGGSLPHDPVCSEQHRFHY